MESMHPNYGEADEPNMDILNASMMPHIIARNRAAANAELTEQQRIQYLNELNEKLQQMTMSFAMKICEGLLKNDIIVHLTNGEREFGIEYDRTAFRELLPGVGLQTDMDLVQNAVMHGVLTAANDHPGVTNTDPNIHISAVIGEEDDYDNPESVIIVIASYEDGEY